MQKTKKSVMSNAIEHLRRFMEDEEGIGTVELILILVVLISLVIIFKDQLTTLVNDIFSQITRMSTSVY